MLLRGERNFDWETREDAEVLAKYQNITSDKERFNKAKDCIKSSILDGKRALGLSTPPDAPSRKNPATVGKLKY